ncbi:MAG TPA: hypothetical protein VGL99_10010 [Chloroflexota bacterium]
MRGLCIASCLLLLVVAGCRGAVEEPPTPAPRVLVAASPSPVPTESEGTPEVQAVRSPAPAVFVRPIASPSPIALPLSVLVGYSGSDLRVGLDLALEENLYLTAAAIAAAAAQRTDELAGLSRTLDQTSSTIAAIVGAVRGSQAQQTLLDGLRAQIATVLSAARGEGATFDVDTTDPVLRARGVALRMLVLNATPIDLATLRNTLAGMDDVARPLAADLAERAAAQLAGPTDEPETQLRLAVDRHVQEHVLLLGLALHPGGPTNADAPNAPLDELAQQLAPIYGEPMARGLASVLHEHTTALLSTNRPLAPVALDQARADLDALLATANPLLPKGIISAQLRAADQELLAAADSFVARDWGSAYSHIHQAARLSQRVGDAIALATTDRYPGRFLATPTPASP